MKLANLEKYRNCGLCEEGIRDFGLCAEGLDRAYELLGDVEHATPRAMVEAYLERGGDWKDVIRVAAFLTDDRSWVWLIARIVFERLPEPLNRYATTLGPDNWEEVLNTINTNYFVDENIYAIHIYATINNAHAASDNDWDAVERSVSVAYYTAYIAEEKAIQRILNIALSAVEGESK